MKGLFRFHIRAGVRLGLRASAAIFGAIVIWMVVQDAPAAFVSDLAQTAFGGQAAMLDVTPLMALAFILPAWAVGRLSSGLNGWLRHLPISSADNRRGLMLALVSVQLPLIVMLAGGALLAHRAGHAIRFPAFRWSIVLVAGAITSLPVQRRGFVVLLAIAAVVITLRASNWWLPVPPALLAFTDIAAGPIRVTTRKSGWRSTRLLHWRIAWRALGDRLFTTYAGSLAAIGAGWLFLHHNELDGRAAHAAIRFTSGTAIVLCITSLTTALAVRRAPWPLARSFPWSATQRVVQDAVFLGAHALPIPLLITLQSGWPALVTVAILPFVSLAGAGYMRLIRDEPRTSYVLLFEGSLAVALITLLPWTTVAWMVASIPALLRAVRWEQRQKITRWSDWQLAHPGDTSLRNAG